MNEERSRTAHESSFRLIVLQHKEPGAFWNSPAPEAQSCSAAANLASCDDASASIFTHARRRTEPADTKKLIWLIDFLLSLTCECGSPLKPPSAAAISQSNMAPSGGTGLGGLPGKKKKKSVVNAQLKMNVRREINAAYERFPSYLQTESLASYSG